MVNKMKNNPNPNDRAKGNDQTKTVQWTTQNSIDYWNLTIVF